MYVSVGACGHHVARKGLVSQGAVGIVAQISRALSTGLVQEPPRRKLQPKEGLVSTSFAFIRNDSNSSEEKRGLHKLLSMVDTSARFQPLL